MSGAGKKQAKIINTFVIFEPGQRGRGHVGHLAAATGRRVTRGAGLEDEQ